MVLLMGLRKPRLNPMSPVPVWRQIAEHIESAIASGDLAPGEKLPSHSELAGEWEVGLSTVSKAVKNLGQRGVLVTSQGKGTFVPGGD